MRPNQLRTLALLTGCLLISAALQAAPCPASPTVLCLSGQRFAVQVRWKDFQGNTGQGQGVGLTPDTGYFWFFSDNNIELVVKVLDARGFNNKFWVFFGALSNVEYTLKVTDTVTGAIKEYQNPSGQFASVGDTSAFPGATAGAARKHETVTAKGTRIRPGSFQAIQRFLESADAKSASPAASKGEAAALTPCPGTPAILSLSNCRFQLRVQWRDSQGNTGSGQAVQLTNDTGYFWFFTDNNVELIVKVLDARAFNGNFWVFYGALSNVQYSIILTDSVTGSFKRYDNPSGAFASVGDTSALRGGFSVAPVKDPGRAGTANLDEAGGTVTATGADGTVFTLVIPAKALLRPETVVLTPVSRIDRFPFSGGLVAGVEIEPEGLDLMVPATLTIQPTNPPPASRTLPYSYSRGGEDFILYLRDVDTASLRLPLVKLAGYGAGQGDSADAASQAGRLPSGPLTPYLQRYARETFLRVLGLISQAELRDRVIQIYREELAQVAARFPRPAGNSGLVTADRKELNCPLKQADPQNPNAVTKQEVEQLIAMLRQKELLPTLLDYKEGDETDVLESLKALLRKCMEDAFDRCVQLNDPYQALQMATIARQLAIMGEEDPLFTTFIEGGLMERCLRFELDFESKIVLVSTAKDAGGTTRLKYRAATVPLRFSYGGNFYAKRSIWEGACTLRPEVTALELPYPLGDCSITVNSGSGTTFTVAAAWVAVMKDPTQSAVRVLYDPGYPQATAYLHCPDSPATELGVLRAWGAEYAVLHKDEAARLQEGTGYMAKDWTQLRFGPGPSQNGEFFAMRRYERGPIPWDGPDLTLTEETFFFLKHTPDKPMPSCP